MATYRRPIPDDCLAVLRVSANRKHVWGGIEMKVAIAIPLFASYLAIGIIIFGHTLWGVPIGFLVFCFLTMIARRCNKRDPYMFAVLAKNHRYNRFFPALAELPAMIRLKGHK